MFPQVLRIHIEINIKHLARKDSEKFLEAYQMEMCMYLIFTAH